jgi:hypothetical protein
VPHYLFLLGSALTLVHNMEVGPRDGVPPTGRPRVVYPLPALFAASAPGQRVEKAAWRVYRDQHGLADSDRPYNAVGPAGPGAAERHLEVVADGPEEAVEKFALYNGVVGTRHEPLVAPLE